MSPFRTVRPLCVAVLSTVVTGSALAATGDVTLGAIAVTTTMGATLPVAGLIDQSGLSVPYVSGTTAFDSYVASTKHDSAPDENVWYSQANVTTGYLTFDLGASYTLDGLAFFGLGGNNNSSVNRINVFADNDSNPTNGNSGLLFSSGTFSTPGSGNPAVVTPNVFSFSNVATRYITIQVLGHPSGAYSGIGEVVFSQAVAAVPEPGTYALMALGLAGLSAKLRRRPVAVKPVR